MSELVGRLRAAGCVFAEEEAALLVAATRDRPDGAVELERLVAARVAGRPLEALLGWAEFDGVRVRVAPGVFVPRQRTVLLVDLAQAAAPPDGVVVDLCCGTGAIAAALGRRRADLRLYAADVDPAAVECARRNLPPERVFEGDLYEALPDRLRGRIDVLVVNAPYVPTGEIARMPPEARDHEHRVALDGGSDGLDVQRRVAGGAEAWLAGGATLLVEVAEHQVDAAVGVLEAAGLVAGVVRDEERGATAVRALGPVSRSGRSVGADPGPGEVVVVHQDGAVGDGDP